MAKVPTPDELAYMEAHESDTFIPNIIATAAICGTISTTCVFLRLVSRRLAHRRFLFQLNDWMVVVAWIFFMTINICWALSTRWGVGRHIIFATDIRMIQIMSVIGEFLYVFTIACIKFSVLSLYATIFPQRKFHYCVWAMAAFIGAWALSGAFSALFQCTPFSHAYDPTSSPDGFCINFGLQNLVSGIVNVITDFIIVGMVIPLVWKLQISRQKKWLVIVTFIIGSSACIVSCVRLAFSLQVGTADGAWDAAPTIIVSMVELTVGILAVSIPTYRPVYRAILGRGKHGKSSTGYSGSNSNGNDTTINIRGYSNAVQNNVNVTATGGSFGTGQPGINITDYIELVRHTNRGGAWVKVVDDDEIPVDGTAASRSTTIPADAQPSHSDTALVQTKSNAYA